MIKRFGVVLLAVLLAGFLFGQKKEKAPAERSVTGIVTAADGAAVAGAIVQLKNMKTLQVRSFIAKEKGDYYFHGLSTDVDYELTAQSAGHSSAKRTLSTFDSHPEVTINLQLK